MNNSSCVGIYYVFFVYILNISQYVGGIPMLLGVESCVFVLPLLTYLSYIIIRRIGPLAKYDELYFVQRVISTI